MDPNLSSSVLAVDGGGSRCRMALDHQGQRLLVEAGATNVTTDLQGSAREIKRAFSELAAQANLSEDQLASVPAYVGLAGILDAVDAEAIRPHLPFRGARITDDKPAALEGALGPEGSGAILHCGTGSFVGYRSEGMAQFAGGWGYLLGDECSATWLSREALAATTVAADGLGPTTDLTSGLMDHLGGVRGIVSFIRDVGPSTLGALASWVTDAAEAGDPVARSIMKRGAGYLTQTLETIGWRHGEPVCLTGGVGPYFARYLPPKCRCVLTAPLGEPIDGALALARKIVAQ